MSKLADIATPEAAAKPAPIKPAPADVDAEKEDTDVPVAKLNTFKFRESCSNRYLVRLPAEVSLEDAKDQRFMEKCLILKSRDFTSFDEVLCVGHSADWATEWLVIDAELAFVNLQLQKVYTFEQQHVSDENRMPAGYSIHRDRVSGKYYAVRDKDNHEFLSGFNRREDCLRALLDHAIFRAE